MSDDEQSLLVLGVQLRDGLAEMIRAGRLRLEDLPDDDQWLQGHLAEMATLLQNVKIERINYGE